MDATGIILGTVLLCGFTLFLLLPKFLARRALARAAHARNAGELTEENMVAPQDHRSRWFIVADCAALFVARLIGGLLGVDSGLEEEASTLASTLFEQHFQGEITPPERERVEAAIRENVVMRGTLRTDPEALDRTRGFEAAFCLDQRNLAGLDRWLQEARTTVSTLQRLLNEIEQVYAHRDETQFENRDAVGGNASPVANLHFG